MEQSEAERYEVARLKSNYFTTGYAARNDYGSEIGQTIGGIVVMLLAIVLMLGGAAIVLLLMVH